MSNTNYFYNLYSTSSAAAKAGYTCSSAIDESATSFDITASSSGSAGVITDSNGNTLASIDLTALHAEGITQYTSETRILQPYSCCLLQGQEYGLACASYFFHIPERVAETSNYEKYIACDFDIIYDNFTPYKLHVSVSADGDNSFVDLINDELDNNNVPVTVSIQQLPDPGTNETYEYLVFLSQKEGYFYYINNLQLNPAFQSEYYPESPFSKALSGMKTIIYKFIEQYHPVKPNCDYCAADCSCGCQTYYDEDTYEVDCDLYRWLISNYQDAVDNLNNFKEAIRLCREYEKDGDESKLDRANELLAGTAYDIPLIEETYYSQMEIIAMIVESIKAFIDETNDYYQDVYWLKEDKLRRISLMKYPNGAFRGIVLIPDWPTNDPETYRYSSLWINHVKSQVKLYRPTKEHQFLPKIYGVLSNATLVAEEDCYKQKDPHFRGIQSNISMQYEIHDGWADHLDTNYVDPYRPEHSIYEDTVYMGQNCYACKKDIIGLFRYMQYVNDNNLWNKVGEGYMIVGNEDDPQSKDKNLPTSLLIYNPNPAPIRIKYMIFS